MSQLRFIFPIDGDCLNAFDGAIREGGLYTEVVVASDSPVDINGQPATEKGGRYVAEVCLLPGKNRLTAKNDSLCEEICVYRLENSIGRYRLSSDDNIVFLWDIHQNRDTYTSIFDNSYLAMYKKAHDLYGAKVHLNLFYALEDDYARFGNPRGYFDLSMMTDRFKDEWRANSDWLKLNFHAMSDLPDCPYKHTDYERIYADCKKVQQEIIRFAGEETLSEETTVHWGECTSEGVRALRDLGVKTLAGYFWMKNGAPMVAYCYEEAMVEHINKRDFWFDHGLDMMYAVIDDVMNLHDVAKNIRILDSVREDDHRSGFIEIMIHEQYYQPDDIAHIPEFEEIVLECCRWAAEKGYKGAFLSEIK